MSKPHVHAASSAKKFGGKPDDYIEIHSLIDSSKAAICDNRHRVLTHNAWFIGVILEKIFGYTIKNSEGNEVSVRDIGEQHVSEDFKGGFVPSVQDFLGDYVLKPWMDRDAIKPDKNPFPFQIPTEITPKLDDSSNDYPIRPTIYD